MYEFGITYLDKEVEMEKIILMCDVFKKTQQHCKSVTVIRGDFGLLFTYFLAEFFLPDKNYCFVCLKSVHDSNEQIQVDFFAPGKN